MHRDGHRTLRSCRQRCDPRRALLAGLGGIWGGQLHSVMQFIIWADEAAASLRKSDAAGPSLSVRSPSPPAWLRNLPLVNWADWLLSQPQPTVALQPQRHSDAVHAPPPVGRQGCAAGPWEGACCGHGRLQVRGAKMPKSQTIPSRQASKTREQFLEKTRFFDHGR